MKNILNHAKTKSLVLFAGAGVSMGMPANLPGWGDLNDLLIKVLWDRIQRAYRIQQIIRDQFISELKDARKNNRFPPDYQAQIMEDQAGIDYFNSLTSVNGNIFNLSHHYIAYLSRHGIFKAIITTNFDTMTEQALASLNVPFEVFFDNDGFIRLNEIIENGKEHEFLPVIKIHGSARSPESMIDTLKQRLKGRAESLNKVLRHFLEKYYFIFSGFSGADLDFNGNYLGIRSAASASPGFCFNYRPGSTIRNSINDLIKVYGSKAEKFESTSEDLFRDLGIGLQLKTEDYPFDRTSESGSSVANRLEQWAQTIAPMKAVNMLIALAESLGNEKASRFMLDKVWKNRMHEDYDDKIFPKFLRNLGKSYLFNFQTRQERADSLGVPLVSYITPATSPFEEYSQELYKNFGKGALHHESNIKTPIGVTLFSLMKAFEGNETLFKYFPEGFIHPDQSNLDLVDMIYYYSFYADLAAEHQKNYELLNIAVEIAVKDFDWMREGLLTGRRALLASRMRNNELASADIKRVLELAGRLYDGRMKAEGLLAQGIFLRNNCEPGKGLKSLKEAREIFIHLLRQPQTILANIELLKTYRIILEDGHNSLLEEVNKNAISIISETETIIKGKMNGFEPGFCFAAGWIYMHGGNENYRRAIEYFTDSYNLARVFEQNVVADWLKEQFIRYKLWDDISTEIQKAEQLQGNSGQ